MTSSGPAPWRQALIDYIRQQANPAHKFGHQPRLYALARLIADRAPQIEADDDVIFAAAYLHDLGVFIGHRPEDPAELAAWNHVDYTCQRTPDLLSELGFNSSKIPAVLACIREHQPHDDPQSPEATIFRDADILEQLGAIGILRSASKLGSDTRFHYFADVRRTLETALEQLPRQLRLAPSRELAMPRIAALQAFLAALDAETAEAGDNLG